jgi:RHS repeat-associated protein
MYFNDADWLGTERARTNSSGTVCETITSLPFGDGQTTQPQNGGCAPTPTFFTGKERDAESGLDMFGARYYGSRLGRFMTPDWAAKPTAVPYAMFGDPQSLNLYAYVRNNPLAKADADGHCGEDLCIVEGGAAIYIGGAALFAGTAAYLATPSGQRSLSTFTSAASQSISDSIHAIGNFFHPNHSGQVSSSPPPSVPTQNVQQGTPASTSQQGAVSNGPINSQTLEPGPYAGAGIPARGPGRDFTQGERDAVNQQGRET